MSITTSQDSELDPSISLSDEADSSRADSHLLFLLLPAIAMSLAWGLRGTIGGGQIGAMIPGVIVTLCLAHLLGWKSSLGIVAAIGTVGIGLGGQETYGQTIGFLRESRTILWGLTGLTLKGAMWGLSGGVLVGLAFVHSLYRWWEIAIGLLIMVAVTLLGVEYIDKPKHLYFSNLLDKPREETWVGLTLGGLALLVYLMSFRREKITPAFALWGTLAGAAGFGVGSLFLAIGNALPKAYRGWPWWKMMEFKFGALFGLGLGEVAYRWRRELRKIDSRMQNAIRPDPLAKVPLGVIMVVGLALAMSAIQLNFNMELRTPFTLLCAGLVLIALLSNRLAWHIAISMTVCGFLRDFLRGGVEREWFAAGYNSLAILALMTLPIVVAVAWSESKARLTAVTALMGAAWIATVFGLLRISIAKSSYFSNPFVSTVFIAEILATTALVIAMRWRRDAASRETT